MKALIFLLGRAVADTALSLLALQRKLTLESQPSRVLIWQSTMILPVRVLTTMLFHWSLVRENRFAPALGQNFTGHKVWTSSVLLIWHNLTCSLPFFIAGIMPELPWMDTSILVTSYRPVWSLVIWHNAPESPIQIFFMNEKMCHDLRCTIYQPPRAVWHLLQSKLSFLHFLYYFFLLVKKTLCHPHLCHWLFFLSQIFYDGRTSALVNPYS